MKSKPIRIIATVFTLALTAVTLKVASLALNYRYNYGGNGDVPYRFYKENGEYDVLFIGSSHVACGIYPMQLWHERGISSYNLSMSGAEIPSSYHIFKNAISFHTPKVAILDTLNMKSSDKISWQLDSLHYSFDIIPLSREKYESLKDLFPDFSQRITYIQPFSLFHNRWKEVPPEKAWDAIFHTPVSVSNGSWFPTNVSSPTISPKTGLPLSSNTVSMDYIRKFVLLCRANNIIPILITVPYPANEVQQQEENSAAHLSKELKVPYYNLNQMEIIDWDTDLNDPSSHVNMSGARKVTDWIGKLLVEEYHLEDHRKDPSYDYWLQDYEAYQERLFDLMRGLSDKKESLMFCNNSAFTARLFIKDGVDLDPVEQKLVAQLGDAIQVEHVEATDSAATEFQIQDLRLEVYDSETGSLICEKQW